MSKNHFVLTAVEVLPDNRLRLAYADGQTFQVDLTERIRTTSFLAPLNDASLFAQAKVGFAGRSVDWVEDELDLGADNLRHLAVEQAGGIGHERIWSWLHDTGLTLTIGMNRAHLRKDSGTATLDGLEFGLNIVQEFLL